VFGGSTPATSFDCSGYICWIFTQSGVKNLPRTTAQGIYNQCTPISASDAKPGDLVFFHSTYSTPNTVTHVGLYVGGGVMLHCGNPIGYTSINTTYWQNHFYSFGRLP
jgi:cell wall-associated NlpC family hydrolase